MIVLHSTMPPGDSVTLVAAESTALPEWTSLAIHGYPDMSYKVDDLDLRQKNRTRIVKILYVGHALICWFLLM